MLIRNWQLFLLRALEISFVLRTCIGQHTLMRISNRTISGDVPNGGCKHAMRYDATSIVSFPMCTGQTDQDLKNGMSIINLIGSRGYLPTCRVLQLMLWMSSEVNEKKALTRDTFVDIGANIGSCTVGIAALGFPVIAAEPVQEHVNTIRGTMALNPSFHIELFHIGIAVAERKIKANFGHGIILIFLTHHASRTVHVSHSTRFFLQDLGTGALLSFMK
jgi:hypothetical protein